MPGPPSSNYGVEESEGFLASISNIIGSVRRWDEIKETIDLDLARDPYVGQEIPGTALRAVTILSQPPLTLYYSVDETRRVLTLVGAYRL